MCQGPHGNRPHHSYLVPPAPDTHTPHILRMENALSGLKLPDPFFPGMTRLVLVPRPVPPPPEDTGVEPKLSALFPDEAWTRSCPLRSWLQLLERTMGPQVVGWASLKSLSFRNHSWKGRRGWQGRASSWAAARTRSRLFRGRIAVPGEPGRGWEGPGGRSLGRATIGPPFSPTRPAAVPAPGSRTCPRTAAPPAGPELALPELHAVGGLAPTFGCERLCCSPSPHLSPGGAALASALFRPHSASFPSLHPWQRSPGPGTRQPERSILSGWC